MTYKVIVSKVMADLKKQPKLKDKEVMECLNKAFSDWLNEQLTEELSKRIAAELLQKALP